MAVANHETAMASVDRASSQTPGGGATAAQPIDWRLAAGPSTSEGRMDRPAALNRESEPGAVA